LTHTRRMCLSWPYYLLLCALIVCAEIAALVSIGFNSEDVRNCRFDIAGNVNLSHKLRLMQNVVKLRTINYAPGDIRRFDLFADQIGFREIDRYSVRNIPDQKFVVRNNRPSTKIMSVITSLITPFSTDFGNFNFPSGYINQSSADVEARSWGFPAIFGRKRESESFWCSGNCGDNSRGDEPKVVAQFA
jgi:hypothetical protein